MKRGSAVSAGKFHYIEKGFWVSICGRYHISRDDEKSIHFKDKSGLMTGKICKNCERILCGCYCHKVHGIQPCTICEDNHVKIPMVS